MSQISQQSKPVSFGAQLQQTGKPQGGMMRQQQPQKVLQPSRSTTDVLNNLNKVMLDGAQTERWVQELEKKTKELQQELQNKQKQIQKLECERITFNGKVQHCESVSKEIQDDIELFRKVHEELVKNVDKVQAKQADTDEMVSKADDLFKNIVPNKFKEMNEEVEGLRNAYEGAKSRYVEKIQDLEKSKKEAAKNLAASMEENKAQAKAAQEKHDELMRGLGESKQTAATAQSKVDELKKDVERKDQELKSEKAKADEQKKNFDENMHRKEEEIKMTTATMQKKLQDSENQNETRQKQIQSLEDDLEKKTQMNCKMDEKVLEVCTFQEAVFVELTGHLEELKKHCQSVMNDLADVKLSKKRTEEELREKKSEIEELVKKHDAHLQNEFRKGKKEGEDAEKEKNMQEKKETDRKNNEHMQKIQRQHFQDKKEADDAMQGERSEHRLAIQHREDQLKEKDLEIKKLVKSAEEKDQKIQELKDDNERLVQTNDDYKEMLKQVELKEKAAKKEEAKAEKQAALAIKKQDEKRQKEAAKKKKEDAKKQKTVHALQDETRKEVAPRQEMETRRTQTSGEEHALAAFGRVAASKSRRTYGKAAAPLPSSSMTTASLVPRQLQPSQHAACVSSVDTSKRKLAEAVLPKSMESKVSRRRVPLHGPQPSPYQSAQKDCFDLFGDLGF